MRRLLLSSVVFILSLVPNLAGAGPLSVQAEPALAVSQGFETYRGYVFDLSENSERKDGTAIADAFRRQLDAVENAGFSPKVLQFFHSVPIIASEMTCLDEGAGIACYGPVSPDRNQRLSSTFTTWDEGKLRWSNPNFVDLAADAGPGVIMVRPVMLKHAEDPVLLHEFLHAYHAKLMPQGFDNLGIRAYHADAMSKQVFGKEEYAMKNHKEFFAVTASIFLAGKESMHEPKTRAQLKEKLPKYYKYLVELFGFDPDPSSVTPVASTSSPPPQSADAAPSGGT
ncbi:hypothetical protein [Bradyrhizobium sp.]|uniref:hypothetical protein n=1 Tax=Bradyrhizobium sp. TaxID=376 RepID=UPI003C732083